MSAEFTIKSNLPKVRQATEQAIERALDICGGLAESHAKDNLTTFPRVDTGNLRNSITYKTHMEGDNEVIIGTAVHYAPYVEYGTGKFADGGGRQSPWIYEDDNGNWHYTEGMKASHFMKNAVSQNTDEYRRVLAAELQNNMH